MEVIFSQACENNKQPILDKLATHFSLAKHVLEIGSGSGQHAVFFAHHLPHLTWQTSDLAVNHPHINHHIDNPSALLTVPTSLTNIKRPVEIDLSLPWPLPSINDNTYQTIDAVFCANTFHIVSWELVQLCFKELNKHLTSNATLCLYGPFNYKGAFTSESNAEFDIWLKERDKLSGIRNIEDITALANEIGLSLQNDHEMPANNRLLVFSSTK